jgi:flagellar hook-length control protein FliK
VEGAAASTKQLKEVSLTGAQREQILLDKAALGDGVIVKTIKPELASAATVLSNTSASTSTIASNASATSPQLMPMLDVQPTLKSEAWGKVMVGRVIWMAKEGVQTAQLKLNPAQLGPVEVRVTLNNDQASVSFVAQHVTTRDTLEQALPRLRESFQANGMALANADVSDQPASQQFDQHHDKQQGDIIFSQSDEEVDELVDNKAVIEETKPGLSLYV